MKTILMFTDSGYWGKGKTLNEAKKNAKYKRSNKVNIYVFSCDPKEIEVYSNGQFTNTPENRAIQITDGFEKL